MARPGVNNSTRRVVTAVLRLDQVQHLDKARVALGRKLGKPLDRSSLLRGLIDCLVDGRISAADILPEPIT